MVLVKGDGVDRIGLLPSLEIVGLVHPLSECTKLVFPRMGTRSPSEFSNIHADATQI